MDTAPIMNSLFPYLSSGRIVGVGRLAAALGRRVAFVSLGKGFAEEASAGSLP